MPANDWNGNGKSDSFDSYMDTKASGESRGGGNIIINPLEKIMETEDNLSDDTREGMALFASFIFALVILMGGVLLAQNAESIILKAIFVVSGISLGGLFFYGMVWASENPPK